MVDRSLRSIGAMNPLRRPPLHTNTTDSNILRKKKQQQNEQNTKLQTLTASSKSLSSPNLHKLGRSELSHGSGSTIKDRPLPQYESGFYLPNMSSDSINEEGQDGEGNELDNNLNNRNRPNSNLSHYKYDESLLVDVLPSFDMYNVLHRHIPQGNVNPDRHDFPPTYQEESTTTTIPSETAERQTAMESNVLQESFNIHDLRPLNTQHYDIDNNMPWEDDLNDSDNIVIDKLYSLPKLSTPVEIEIRVTKNAPKPDNKAPEESMLKEYTSGDIIHGYCIIHNRSPNRLKFEMFYVTLEGYISIIDRQKGKRTVKRFLRMVDLSASWSYTNIDLSSGIDINVGEVDTFDGCIIGLNNSRILEPNTKYKKIFMFKLPNQLLDVSCKHEQFCHCLLPPSFGIDKFKDHFKYSGVKINNVLGCGHLGIKGSPIITKDLSDDDISINYTIDARIVGKDIKSHKLNIMKEREYNLRVLPFEFGSSLRTENKASKKQLKDLQILIQERLDALQKIFKKAENNEHILNSDIHGEELSGTFDNNTELDSQDILLRKLDQLHINNRLDDTRNISELSDFKNISPQINTVESELSYRYKSKHKSKSKGSNKSSGFFSGFMNSASSSLSLTSSVSSPASPNLSSTIGSSSNNKLNNTSDSLAMDSSVTSSSLLSPVHTASTSTEKSGLLVVTASIPLKSLPYWSPSIIRKTNKFDSKNKHDQENWSRLTSFVSEDEKGALDCIPLKIACIQSNNSSPHDPPSIQSITTQLIVLTARSDFSIPIKLSYELLGDKNKLKNINRIFSEFKARMSVYKKRFSENKAKINELYNLGRTLTTSKEISFKDFISDQIKSDVESLCNITVRRDVLNEIFKKQSQTTNQEPHNNNGNSTNLHQSPLRSNPLLRSPGKDNDFVKQSFQNGWVKCSKLEYEKNARINLEMTNDIGETLIPSFESCLCCRFYCIRAQIKFDNNIGSTTIDIPINVKNMNV